ncbi:MAG: PorT family protein [Gemmatimonadota bacterium]|nr:PorT family protein [Gemmatimonadota bacterium]MDH5282547.1 PorT family protein [Gemmatimonadota bacterium]
MRRTFRLALLLAVAPAAPPLEAQSRVGVGVEFGYTRADLDGADATSLEDRSGAVGGIFLDLRLNRRIAFTFGPSLAQRGGEASLSGGNLVIDLVTIDLPLLIRARLPVGSFALLLEAGGMPGFRIGCNVELQLGGAPSSRLPCNDPALDPVGTFAPWDVAAVAGLGVGIPVRGSQVGLKARLSRGFIPVIESRDIYNRSISILLELPF